MFDRFARLAVKVGHLRLILPNGQELSYGSPDNVKTAPGELVTTHLRAEHAHDDAMCICVAGCTSLQSILWRSLLDYNAGESWRGLPLQKATVRIFDCAFFRKIIMRHDTGLGESYMDNDYEVSDVLDKQQLTSSSQLFLLLSKSRFIV